MVQKHKTPINGNLGLLFSDDDMGVAERVILCSYLEVTKNIAGCQAIRSRIGHILFGFRCIYGEVLFLIVSPNRRHSALLLRLSRARLNDVMLQGRDPLSQDPHKVLAYWRHRYASPDAPKAFSAQHIGCDPTGSTVLKEIELPDVFVRQAWVSQDPLASVHHYLAIMYVVIPAAFGLRMCLHCPDCNGDVSMPFQSCDGCSDYLGNNHKSMGGHAGLGAALAIGTEFQGDGTPHGHGFVALHNMFQFNNLNDCRDDRQQHP